MRVHLDDGCKKNTEEQDFPIFPPCKLNSMSILHPNMPFQNLEEWSGVARGLVCINPIF